MSCESKRGPVKDDAFDVPAAQLDEGHMSNSQSKTVACNGCVIDVGCRSSLPQGTEPLPLIMLLRGQVRQGEEVMSGAQGKSMRGLIFTLGGGGVSVRTTRR